MDLVQLDIIAPMVLGILASAPLVNTKNLKVMMNAMIALKVPIVLRLV